MTNSDRRQAIQDQYRRFAANEAAGVSPAYEAFALAVAADPPTLDFLATLPRRKAQPNLLFGVVRHLFGVPDSPRELLRLVERHEAQVRSSMLARSTQTNEPARCATLLPVLCRLPQPLALIEVGAAAGLCLLPDRYGYDFGSGQLGPAPECRDLAPVFPCHFGAGSAPLRIPEVVWRKGLDLAPVDLRDEDSVAWLETLVWPEQTARLARLRAACELALADPPTVVRGDLLTHLTELAAEAPRDATLVIFHSAVLGYVRPLDRERFTEVVATLPATWVSNEAPQVLPEVLSRLDVEPRADRFILALDGEPVATTGPHGQSFEWLGGACDDWQDV